MILLNTKKTLKYHGFWLKRKNQRTEYGTVDVVFEKFGFKSRWWRYILIILRNFKISGSSFLHIYNKNDLATTQLALGPRVTIFQLIANINNNGVYLFMLIFNVIIFIRLILTRVDLTRVI